jgi:hypothetical protein
MSKKAANLAAFFALIHTKKGSGNIDFSCHRYRFLPFFALPMTPVIGGISEPRYSDRHCFQQKISLKKNMLKLSN